MNQQWQGVEEGGDHLPGLFVRQANVQPTVRPTNNFVVIVVVVVLIVFFFCFCFCFVALVLVWSRCRCRWFTAGTAGQN